MDLNIIALINYFGSKDGVWFKYNSGGGYGERGRVQAVEVAWDEFGQLDEYGAWEDVFVWGNQNSEENYLVWLQVQFCQEYIRQDENTHS